MFYNYCEVLASFLRVCLVFIKMTVLRWGTPWIHDEWQSLPEPVWLPEDFARSNSGRVKEPDNWNPLQHPFPLSQSTFFIHLKRILPNFAIRILWKLSFINMDHLFWDKLPIFWGSKPVHPNAFGDFLLNSSGRSGKELILLGNLNWPHPQMCLLLLPEPRATRT